MRPLTRSLFALPFALVVAGCGAPEDNLPADDQVADSAGAGDPELKADLPGLSFTVFTDDVGAAAAQATRRVIVSNTGYRALFGHDAPGIDFRKEWVFFYAAGVQRTGGYKAAVESIRNSGASATLKVVTALESPGPGCVVTQALTRPHVLVRFKIPSPRPIWARYYTHDTSRSCAPKVDCVTDADCVVTADYCRACDCRALPKTAQAPACDGPGVRCFADPCATKKPVCQAGKCVAAAKQGVACGRATCAVGQVCCNASCGICTPPDGVCIQIACNN